jgi:hypothetical protein
MHPPRFSVLRFFHNNFLSVSYFPHPCHMSVFLILHYLITLTTLSNEAKEFIFSLECNILYPFVSDTNTFQSVNALLIIQVNFFKTHLNAGSFRSTEIFLKFPTVSWRCLTTLCYPYKIHSVEPQDGSELQKWKHVRGGDH